MSELPPGLPARSIAAEPKGVDNTASRVQRHDIANSQLQSAIQIWPTSRDIRNFALVFYRGDLDGLSGASDWRYTVIAQIAGRTANPPRRRGRHQCP